MRLKVLAIDKLRQEGYRLAAADYRKRFRRYCSFEELELKGARGKRSDSEIRQQESERLLRAVAPGAYVVVLDERGELRDSRAFASWLEERARLHSRLFFLLGGALGHSSELRSQASELISLSPMTLPHELARVVLYEQLYRALTILRGEPYHK